MSNTQGNTQLALPTQTLEELAKAARDAAAKERPSLGKISLKSGVMSYSGGTLPGNKTDVVVLTAVHKHTYYAGRYDANNIVNPNCFAIGDDADTMVPHPNVTSPEHSSCKGCPKAEWGSDLNGGKGKACKQTRRLILLPSAAVKDEQSIKTAELAILDVPVTSTRNYSNFVNSLAASANLPTWAAVTNVAVVPDPKTQFKVTFTPTTPITDPGLIGALKQRMEQAKQIALTPYDETNNAAAAEQQASNPKRKY